jgi:hypothetical protein
MDRRAQVEGLPTATAGVAIGEAGGVPDPFAARSVGSLRLSRSLQRPLACRQAAKAAWCSSLVHG